MSLSRSATNSLLERGFSRRQLGRIAGVLTAGATGMPFFSEYAQAQQAEDRMQRRGNGARPDPNDPDAVRITSNENPLGPCKEGLEALYKVAPMGGRYSPTGENADFLKMVAQVEGVKENYVATFPGSSTPLFASTCAFTSPTRSWTMANPGYSGGAPAWIGSKLVRVPLRDDMSHDVEAMIKADPNAGAYYICNPNNPTGTVTSMKDIQYVLDHKAKDAVVVIDEAYIHFSDNAQMAASTLVANDKDVVILRTFSKIYGMAGLRAGAAIGRPDLLEKVRAYYGGGSFMPITATACAAASMRVKNLIPERKKINRDIREATFAYLEKRGISYIPSETNFFMMTVKGRTGQEVNQEMAKYKVFIGRTWPVWPEKVRVTVGTMAEMQKFQAALDKVIGA